MERPTFFRQSDDLDLGYPSDSDEEIFANAPRMAARSMALMAKKRGALAKAPKTPAPTKWADMATDDEDMDTASGCIRFRRARLKRSKRRKGDELVWDPIGLGSSTSSVSDLLWKKTDAKEGCGSGTVFDKWSWSTTATTTPLDDLQTDDEDLTSQSQAQPAQPQTPHEQARVLSQPQQLAQAHAKLHTPVHQTPRMPTEQPQMQQPQMQQQQMQQLQVQQQQMQELQMHQLQMHQLQMQQPQMQQPQMQQPQTQPQMQAQPVAMLPMQHGMLFAVPYMPAGMGMLPMVMSSRAGAPAQPDKETAGTSLMPQEPTGAPMGMAHRFHQKNSSMGVMSADARTFTKKYNKGRLSIISENKVHFQGTVRYSLQFTEGELCSADGVGFILSSDLPCTRNIQKIISIFANRTGRICIRVHDEVVRCSQRVKELEVGDWLEVNADLVNQTVAFTVWPQDNSAPSSASVSFKEVLANARGRVNGVPRNPCGFLAVVIKHLGVSVRLGS